MHKRLIILVLIMLAGLATVVQADDDSETCDTAECQAQVAYLTESLSIIPEENRPIVVCASGVGGVICEFRFEDPDDVQILTTLCGRGVLGAETCNAFTAGDSVAQVPSSCPLLVNFNLELAAQNCSETERNEGCYGAETVLTTPANLLNEPGDIEELTGVIAFNAQGYDLRNADYGLSKANSHANLHLEVEGGLRVLIFGNVRVENAVTTDEAVILPEEPVTVTVASDTPLFDQPAGFGPQTELGQATADSSINVDAVSDDEAWARIMLMTETVIGENASAWISTEAITFPNDTIPAELPRIEQGDVTPMQSFYFVPGGSSVPSCEPTLGGLVLLQAPRGIETVAFVNGAPILMIGTVEVRFANGDDQLELRVVSGVAVVNPGGDDAQVVAPGYGTRIDHAPTVQNLGADNTTNDYTLDDEAEWEEPFELSRSVVTGFSSLETLPLSLLNQTINAPQCGPETEGEDCDIEYDFADDEALIADLCADGVLPADLEVCE